MGLSVFFSHSGRDRSFGQQFAAQAQASGIGTYLFQNDARPGAPLSGKIQQAIRQSDMLVVLLTQVGDQSRYVHQEIGFGLGAGKLVIPLLEDGIDEDALGMLSGLEYLPFNIHDPERATGILASYLTHLQQQREDALERERLQDRLS